VFETSVGKVGFLICYDVDFAEAAACLALNGAEILLHPTVGYNFPDEEEVVGEARLRTRATDNHLALAYANFGPAPGRSAIYSHSGAQVACCGRLVDALAVADLDLRAPRVQDWGDLGRHDHRDQLTRKRRPDTYGVLAERRPPLLEAAHGPEGRLYEYREDVGLP
jgi:predicted amidohydrolase